jgi:hypothetical protein
MSNNKRRAEKRVEQEALLNKEYDDRRKEEARKEALTMWERIEEAEANKDVKDILHRLAEKLGMESL